MFIKRDNIAVFPYKEEFVPLGKNVFRPIALVNVQHAEDMAWHPYSFYVDSGADTCVINKQIGNLMGLRLKPGEEKVKVRGIGGEVQAVYRKIKIKIINKSFLVNTAWILSGNVPMLLGRRDVFKHFEITFLEKQKQTKFVEI